MTTGRFCLRIVLGATLLLAANAGTPAMAQMMLPGVDLSGGDEAPDPATQQRRDKVDREYRATKGGLPASTTTDPWANMRGDDKAAAKPAPAKKTTEKKKPAVQ